MNCFQTVFGLTPAIPNYIGGITMNDHPPHVQLPSRCLDMTWEYMRGIAVALTGGRSWRCICIFAFCLHHPLRSLFRPHGLRTEIGAEIGTGRDWQVALKAGHLELRSFPFGCDSFVTWSGSSASVNDTSGDIIWMSFGSSSKRFETDAVFDAKDRWPVSLWRRHWALFFGLAARGTARIAYGMQSRYQGTV